MPEITLTKDGVLTSKTYVKATRDYTCQKGTSLTITLDWPEGVTVKGPINVTNLKCPCCDEPVAIPKGEHSVVDGVLVTA